MDGQPAISVTCACTSLASVLKIHADHTQPSTSHTHCTSPILMCDPPGSARGCLPGEQAHEVMSSTQRHLIVRCKPLQANASRYPCALPCKGQVLRVINRDVGARHGSWATSCA
jgi:hypothetical protein